MQIFYEGVTTIDLESILTHVVMGLTVFIDLVISGHQIVFLRDIVGPMAIAVGFSMFSYFFYIAGATDCHGNSYIYPFLDWNNVEKAVKFCVGQTVAVTWIIYPIIFFLCKLRMFIFTKIFRDDVDEEMQGSTFDESLENQNEKSCLRTEKDEQYFSSL